MCIGGPHSPADIEDPMPTPTDLIATIATHAYVARPALPPRTRVRLLDLAATTEVLAAAVAEADARHIGPREVAYPEGTWSVRCYPYRAAQTAKHGSTGDYVVAIFALGADGAPVLRAARIERGLLGAYPYVGWPRLGRRRPNATDATDATEATEADAVEGAA